MKTVLQTIVVVSAFSGALAMAALTAEGAKVFSGENGKKLTIVTLKPRTANKVLILFEGTDSDFDGRVLLHEIKPEGNSTEYVTQWNGGPFRAVFAKSMGGGEPTYYFNPPVGRGDKELWFSSKLSKGIDTAEILRKYEARKPEFKGAAQSFDPGEEKQKEESKFKEALTSMNSACGTTIAGQIDWKSVKDETLKSYEVGSLCANVANAIESICGSELGKNAVKEKISKISCQWDSKVGISLGSKTVSWKTTSGNGGQDNYAKHYLEDTL